jgi:hypothetical protein
MKAVLSCTPRQIYSMTTNLLVSAVTMALGTFVAASPHRAARIGDRNDSPTWLLNAELRSYVAIASSEFFFVWQACSSRLKASCFQNAVLAELVPQNGAGEVIQGSR